MQMPRRVTAAQLKERCRQVNQGASLRTAAMRANIDRELARTFRDRGKLPNEARQPRTWRTWPDALADVWPAVAEQWQREPRLQAKTLWEWLQRTHPGAWLRCGRRRYAPAPSAPPRPRGRAASALGVPLANGRRGLWIVPLGRVAGEPHGSPAPSEPYL